MGLMCKCLNTGSYRYRHGKLTNALYCFVRRPVHLSSSLASVCQLERLLRPQAHSLVPHVWLGMGPSSNECCRSMDSSRTRLDFSRTMVCLFCYVCALIATLAIRTLSLFVPFNRMKLVDILYVHPRYRTTEEILADPTVKDTRLEEILTSESVRNMGISARLASEEAMKVSSIATVCSTPYSFECNWRRKKTYEMPFLYLLYDTFSAQGRSRGAIWQAIAACSSGRHVTALVDSSTGFYCRTLRSSS